MSKPAAWEWNPTLDWSAPAGRLLDRMVSALPENTQFEIVVFGSSPLQLGIEPAFVSGDVDIFSDTDFTDLLHDLRIDKSTATFYIEQLPQHIFIASPAWRARAYIEPRGSVTFVFPHPLDILVAKIKRLAEKDLNAYRLVKSKTGHPTEEELIGALRAVVDVYRPAFDEEEPGGDPWVNTRIVFQELYGRDIDVRAEIIRPALEERKRHTTAPPHKENLRRLIDEAERERRDL